MSSTNPDGERRTRELSVAAHKLTRLPVADQYRMLAEKHGLRLSDTGWEVVYDPDGEGLQEHVSIIPVVQPQGN